VRRDGGSVFPAHAITGDEWPVQNLSTNEIARALISMMARSTSRSNERPNALMQDLTAARSTNLCDARPDHTFDLFRRAARALLFAMEDEMGLLDGILGGVIGAEALSRVKDYIEKRGGIQGVVAEFEKTALVNRPSHGYLPAPIFRSPLSRCTRLLVRKW
jgi:hypothetical protein